MGFVSFGSLLSAALGVVLVPFLFILVVVLLLASFGRSLGVRKLYVKVLLHIFEFCRKSSIATRKEQLQQRTNNAQQKTFLLDSSDEEDSDSDADDPLQQDAQPEVDVSQKRASLLKYGKDTRHNVISRKDNLILSPSGHDVEKKSADGSHEALSKKILAGKTVSAATFQNEFDLGDVLDYVKTGVASIIEDEVTQRFEAEELESWNLLTRTGQGFHFVSWKLTVIWIAGFFFRYFVLLPGRICILFVGLVWMGTCMSLVGCLPEGRLKQRLHYSVYTTSFQILGESISAVVTYHNQENKAASGGICVANHTSPIDVLILACDNAYALIGQGHGGFIGFMQSILQRASHHIWFERGEFKDRLVVVNRLKEHVEDPNKLPILIFPEGTCINNTSVMQFKKGSFEVGGTIYPVAIKYDPKFGDAFWNSSKNGMISYLYMMMTSWAIVCDVWYLPPMTRREGEDAITFANRVKSEIAREGGLVDLVWDGNLKRQQVKKEWKEIQQEEFSRRLKKDS